MHRSRVVQLLSLLSTVLATDRATDDFGYCLDGVSIPESGHVTCSNYGLPQICTFSCNPGYFAAAGTTAEITCENSICTNQCQTSQETCYGTVPRNVTAPCLTGTGSCTYTDYFREARPCCKLQQLEAPWCSVLPCTGDCSNPGIYTYTAAECPSVCVPFRDIAQPDFRCETCQLPLLPPTAAYHATDAGTALVGCIDGFWGTQISTTCSQVDGAWYPPVSSVRCTTCVTHPVWDIDPEYFELIEEPGKVTVRCKAPYYREAPGEEPVIAQCDRVTGAWTEFIYTPSCEWFDPYVTPSVSPSASMSASVTASVTPTVTPSTSMLLSATPSPSKSPRPAKVKGSRAPSAPPKIFGSRAPSSGRTSLRGL